MSLSGGREAIEARKAGAAPLGDQNDEERKAKSTGPAAKAIVQQGPSIVDQLKYSAGVSFGSEPEQEGREWAVATVREGANLSGRPVESDLGCCGKSSERSAVRLMLLITQFTRSERLFAPKQSSSPALCFTLKLPAIIVVLQ